MHVAKAEWPQILMQAGMLQNGLLVAVAADDLLISSHAETVTTRVLMDIINGATKQSTGKSCGRQLVKPLNYDATFRTPDRPRDHRIAHYMRNCRAPDHIKAPHL